MGTGDRRPSTLSDRNHDAPASVPGRFRVSVTGPGLTNESEPTMTAPTDSADTIAELRARIDALDTDIVRLISERAALSAQVQATRIASSGLRLELGRERDVIGNYHRALGTSGTAIADAVLRACRG